MKDQERDAEKILPAANGDQEKPPLRGKYGPDQRRPNVPQPRYHTTQIYSIAIAMNHVPLATLTGYASALPTPFKGEDIDEEAFARFCDWQIGERISALVVAGTTGEAPTLSMVERRPLVCIAAETADGRVP